MRITCIYFIEQVLGRLASQISTVVQGKDKPTYAPNRDDGDMCIVVNAKDVCVTGRKLTDKVYYWHTGQVLLFSAVSFNELKLSVLGNYMKTNDSIGFSYQLGGTLKVIETQNGVLFYEFKIDIMCYRDQSRHVF